MILEITILLVLAQISHIKINKNKFDIDDNSINNSKINKKIKNLLNSTKKISFRVNFFIFKASLAFISSKRIVIKALILYYFDIKL